MLARMRTAVKFFACGLLIGIVFAPNAGAETRAQIKQWVMQQVPGLRAE